MVVWADLCLLSLEILADLVFLSLDLIASPGRGEKKQFVNRWQVWLGKERLFHDLGQVWVIPIHLS